MKTETHIERAILSPEEETRRGRLIARLLKLKHTLEYPDRYMTEWGTKTNIGLYRVMERIVLDGE